MDLVIEHPSGLSLVEAKSAATPSSSLLAGTRRVRGHLAELHPDAGVVCVYGGDDPQERSDGLLVPWHRLHHSSLHGL